MAYKINLPSETMRKLWLLKTYCAAPAIIEQVRNAVRSYVADQEARIGTSVEDVAQAIKQARHEKRSDDQA